MEIEFSLGFHELLKKEFREGLKRKFKDNFQSLEKLQVWQVVNLSSCWKEKLGKTRKSCHLSSPGTNVKISSYRAVSKS